MSRYDVFLCHNSAEKPVVRQLRDELKSRTISTWFDEDDLVPGRPWQDALEQAIESIRAAAICVGESGFGPWQNEEMRAYLEQFVQRKASVIPVLLPDAPETPELPLFLSRFTWVDMRSGFTDENLHRLICGIRNLPPGKTPMFRVSTTPQPESSDRDVQNFIAEELLRAVCRQLNSGKEPFRSLRAKLTDRLKDETVGDGDMSLDFLREALSHKLNQVMGALRQYVDKLETDEHVADLHKLTDSLGAAVVNANSIAQLHEQLEKEGRIRIPELADMYLCEAVFTALYQEPATWTRQQAIDQNKIHGIESASTKPQQRSLEIRRRLIEEYFSDRVERQPGESQTNYDRRLDKFATHRLPSVLRTAREDQKPWLISFVGAVDFLEREFEQDPELWRHVIKVENSEQGDHIVIPEIGDFQERLRLIHQKFDELQGKK